MKRQLTQLLESIGLEGDTAKIAAAAVIAIAGILVVLWRKRKSRQSNNDE